MSVRWLSLLVWSLVAASGVYWGLQLFARAAPAPAQTVLAAAGDAQRGDLTRLLGADTPAPVAAATPEPVADNRFALLGVVSERGASSGATSTRSRDAVALIAVDGKPAKAFKVGATVDGQQVLQSVGPRSASLGPRGAPAQVQLQIPLPAEAARGVPAGLSAAAAPGAVPSPAPPAMQPPPMPSPTSSRSFAPPPTAGLNMPQAPGGSPVMSPGSSPAMSPGMSPGGLPQVSPPPQRAPRVPGPVSNTPDNSSLR